MRFLPRLLVLLATLVATPAFADFVIAPSGGNVTGAQVSAALVTGDYNLATVSGNIVVNDTVNWSSHTLTLTAADSVNVNRVMTASGTARLVVNTGANGNVNMDLAGNGFGGRVDFSGSTANPNGKAFTLIDGTGNFQATVAANNAGNYALAADNTAGVSLRVANFYGHFDGLGHVVKNVDISGSNSYTALFGYLGTPGAGVPPGAVRNVGVQGSVSASGWMFVGGLAGVNDGSISNSFFIGNVGGGTYVGGLAGVNSGTISNANAYIGGASAEYLVGGLVGQNNAGGRISKAFATAGNMSATSNVGVLVGNNKGSIANASTSGFAHSSNGPVGGLVGSNESPGIISYSYTVATPSGNTVGGVAGANSSSIQYTYAAGDVSGNYAGGLVGSNSGTISNAYATGNLNSSGPIVGGLVGGNQGRISNAYALGRVSGSSNLGGLVGKPEATGSVDNSFYAITDANGQVINGYDGTTAVTNGAWIGNVSGTAKTRAQLQTPATFSDPSWSLDDAAGTGKAWRIYGGLTAPLLRAYLSPLRLAVDNATGVDIYDGNPHNGPGTWVATPANYDTSRVLGTAAVIGGVHAGTHPLRLTGLYSTQDGYDIDFVPGSVAIRPAPLTITPQAGQHKAYGTDDPQPGFAYDRSGVIGSDDAGLSGNLGRAAGENVNFYTYNLGNLHAGNTDYTVFLDPAAPTFAIAPAPVILSPDSGQMKVFGTADPIFTFSAGGLVDAVSPRYWDANGNYASAAQINDATRLTGALGRTPGEAAGPYPFTLGTLDAGSNYVLELVPNAPTFGIYTVPTVTALSPAFGPMTGGVAVTITGTGFASGVTTVKFGATAATSVTVNSPTSLVATAPSGNLGTVDVTVTTPGGTSATSSPGRYEYRLDVALSASIGDRGGHAAYGAIVQYDIVIDNTGSQAAGNITIAAAVPPQLDPTQTLWLCLDAASGLCAAEGSGALNDVVNLPAHGSVRYKVIALVRDDAQGDVVPMRVTATGPYPYETASAAVDSWLVIFRGGFDG